MEASQRHRAELFKKVDEIAKDFSAHRAEMKAHMSHEEELAEGIEKLGQRVGDLENFKVRAMSLAAGFAAAGGILGQKLGKMLGVV